MVSEAIVRCVDRLRVLATSFICARKSTDRIRMSVSPYVLSSRSKTMQVSKSWGEVSVIKRDGGFDKWQGKVAHYSELRFLSAMLLIDAKSWRQDCALAVEVIDRCDFGKPPF